MELTLEGEDFLTYARDFLDRSNLLALRYKNQISENISFSVSTQHLPYALRAFQSLLAHTFSESYDAAVRETSTSNVIYDVSTGKSELGVLAFATDYLDLMQNTFQKYHLDFIELGRLKPFVFLRRSHPLANRTAIQIDDLAKYPFVTFDQDDAPSVSVLTCQTIMQISISHRPLQKWWPSLLQNHYSFLSQVIFISEIVLPVKLAIATFLF